MTKCPICTKPMPVFWSCGTAAHRAVVCSRPCVVILRQWARWMKEGRAVDEAVIQRLIYGDRVDSIKSERLEATRQLLHWGHSSVFIAGQLRVNQRSINRYRHELLQRGVQL